MPMQKNAVTCERFNDGIVNICEIDDDGNAGRCKEKLRFSEKTVGYNRFYEAMTAKVQIDKLIRVPFQRWLTTEYVAVIGSDVYEIHQVQTIADSFPKSTALSLHYTRQRSISSGQL